MKRRGVVSFSSSSSSAFSPWIVITGDPIGAERAILTLFLGFLLCAVAAFIEMKCRLKRSRLSWIVNFKKKKKEKRKKLIFFFS